MTMRRITLGKIIASLKLCLVAPFGMFCRLFRPDLWLVTERPDQARDNGYCFFRYLRERHPGIDVCYVIRKGASDERKVARYGRVCAFDSWRHYFLYCLSRVHISAHVGGCNPSGAPLCRYLKRVLGFKDVFIPHGVSYGVAEFCLQKYAKIDLFICSGKPEYDNVLANYGYSEDEVAYTGFPRLDGWRDMAESSAGVDRRLIVLMPTWRLYLAQNPDTVFEKTAYYAAYQSLLSDGRLAAFLEEQGIRLVFYLHHNMRKYVASFRASCPNIVIVDDAMAESAEYDIQGLLRSSALLITDYSSVHFDFAYMNKPVVYYQFDREEFFRRQYGPAGFDARKDGFGPVAETGDGVVDAVVASWRRGFKVEPTYHDRMRRFYRLYDGRNCDRVYEAIVGKVGGNGRKEKNDGRR